MGEFSDYKLNDNLLGQLAELDERDDVTVTRWEATFIESLLYKRSRDTPLTGTQESKIRQILDRYNT